MIKYLITWCVVSWTAAPSGKIVKHYDCKHSQQIADEKMAKNFYNMIKHHNNVELAALKIILVADTTVLFKDTVTKYNPIHK